MNDAIPATNPGEPRSRRPAVSPRVGLAAALAGATALCAVLGAWVVAAPQGALAGASPFAYAHDARAALHMKAALSGEDLDDAEREARAALALSPALAVTWVRLAYIETWRHRRITPEAVQDLSRSYQVSPLGPDVSPARIKFVLEAWPVLPPELREQAFADFEALWRRRRAEATQLAEGIVDPQGRLVAGMALAEFEAKAALNSKP